MDQMIENQEKDSRNWPTGYLQLVLLDTDLKINVFYVFKKTRWEDREFYQRTEICKREPNGNKITVVVQLLSCVWLWPHGLQHSGFPCFPLSSGVCSNSCPLSWWCYLTISSSVSPFSFCLQSFPASGSFPVSQLFASGGQSIGASASASVLSVNIQGWFPLGLTGFISLQSKGLSSVFSSTRFKGINSSALSLLYGSALTSMHDYCKNHSFDWTNLCWQGNVLAF